MKPTNLKLFLFSFFLASALAFVAAALPNAVLAQNTNPSPLTSKQRCDNFKKQFEVGSGNATTNVVSDLPQFCSASGVAAWAINILAGFAGAVAVLFLVLGGYFYMASAGNEEQAEKGKKMLIYSILGLTVVIMAYAIVRIVGNLLTSPK